MHIYRKFALSAFLHSHLDVEVGVLQFGWWTYHFVTIYYRAYGWMQELGMPFITYLLLLIERSISAWHILHKFIFTGVTYQQWPSACIWRTESSRSRTMDTLHMHTRDFVIDPSCVWVVSRNIQKPTRSFNLTFDHVTRVTAPCFLRVVKATPVRVRLRLGLRVTCQNPHRSDIWSPTSPSQSDSYWTPPTPFDDFHLLLRALFRCLFWRQFTLIIQASCVFSDPTHKKTKHCVHFSRVRELRKVNTYYRVITLWLLGSSTSLLDCRWRDVSCTFTCFIIGFERLSCHATRVDWLCHGT